MIHIKSFYWIRAGNIISKVICQEIYLANSICPFAETNVATIKIGFTNSCIDSHGIIRQLKGYLALFDVHFVNIYLPINWRTFSCVFFCFTKFYVEHTTIKRCIRHIDFLISQVNIIGNNLEITDTAIYCNRIYPISRVNTSIREFYCIHTNMQG